MRSEHDGDRIDAAIDAAARALTSAEPSAALRAAVRNRIGRRHRAWWLAPAAVAAAMVVVALLGRTLSGPAAPGGPDRVRPTEVRPTTDYASTSGPAFSTALPQPDVERPVPTTPMRRLVAAFELPPEELEPVIPPLTIAPLETRLISVDTSSGVMPIEIEPLRIEPLQGE